MTRHELQCVVAACAVAPVDIDMAETEIRSVQIGLQRSFVNGWKKLIWRLVNIAVTSLMDLVRSDVVHFEQCTAARLILHAGAVLIAERVVISRIEHLQQRGRLRRGWIEWSKLPRTELAKADVVEACGPVVRGQQTQRACLRDGVPAMEHSGS